MTDWLRKCLQGNLLFGAMSSCIGIYRYRERKLFAYAFKNGTVSLAKLFSPSIAQLLTSRQIQFLNFQYFHTYRTARTKCLTSDREVKGKDTSFHLNRTAGSQQK